MRKKKGIGIFIVFALIIAVGCTVYLNRKNIVRKMYPITYSEIIVENAKKYNLDPYLVFAVIKTESAFDKEAKSSQNAIGLMQITGPTAKWIAEKNNVSNFKENDLYDPQTNIQMGCWYLNNLSEEFEGKLQLVLAAYNGGRGNVNKWLQDSTYSDDGENLKVIPYKETDEYVKKVEVNMKMYKDLYKDELSLQ